MSTPSRTRSTREGDACCGGTVAGLVVGLLAGAGIALLLAPKSGRAMRAELQTRVDVLTAQLDTRTRHVATRTRQYWEETRKDLQEALDTGRAAAADKAAVMRRDVGLS